MSGSTRGYFSLLEIARGFAAFAVAFYHMNHMVAERTPTAFTGLMGDLIHIASMVGVDYFFVLSGFLMMNLHRSDFGNVALFPRYALKRILRIYPMYWLALGLSAVLVALSTTSQFPDLLNGIKQILLITPEKTENADPRILGVSWTLEIEIFFYACFGLLILSGLTFRVMFYVLGAVMAGLYAPMLLLFFAGFAASYCLQKTEQGLPKQLVFTIPVFCVLIVFALKHMVHDKLMLILMESIPLAVTIYALACYDKLSNPHRIPSLFITLGKSSYSIYLFHIPVGLVAYAVALKLNVSSIVPGWGIVIALTLITGFVGILIANSVELPLNRKLQSWVKNRYPHV